MAHAYSSNALLTKKFDLYDFKDEWEESFGKPAKGGIWFIWGMPGNGKTTFTLMLVKYFTQFGRVAYDSLEEGFVRTMQLSWQRVEMDEVANKIILLHREPIEELKKRLRKKKSPAIVVIDSLQYAKLKYSQYTDLKDEFQNKTFIFISHADGEVPRGSTAKDVHFDCDVKIHVKKFKAFVHTSRFGGNQRDFIIWKEGADRYWNKQI